MLRYSIIIATYNRLEELNELLPSLVAQTFPADQFEVIIVDDGSTDGTKEYIHSLSTEFDLRYLSQENKGPGAARNYGMSKAEGDYFIFVDSDCLLPPTYLQAIDDSIEENHWDAFGGPDTYHESFSPMQKAINYSMTSFIGTGGTRGSKKSVGKFYPRSFNMGISREVYEKIGGMNDLRHGQDMDLSARIYEAGFKVGFIPDAYVYHKRRTSLSKFFRQIHNWGVARINLGASHEGMLKPVHLLPAGVLFATVGTVILGVLFPVFRPLLALMIVGMILIAAVAFVQSFGQYHSIKTSFLSIVTLFVQVYAYGLGLVNAILQKLRGAEVAEGITKNYYGKNK